MIDKKHIKNLKAIVGEENFYHDKAHMIAYSYDATRERYEPDGVIFPRHEEDVSKILRYCNENGIVTVPEVREAALQVEHCQLTVE